MPLPAAMQIAQSSFARSEREYLKLSRKSCVKGDRRDKEQSLPKKPPRLDLSPSLKRVPFRNKTSER